MSSDPTDVVGRRIGAALVDMAILFVVLMTLAVLMGDTESRDGSVSIEPQDTALFVWVALSLVYYGVLEAINGQTLGKRALSVRVLDQDGMTRASVRQVVIRTLLRLIDGIAFYAVALAIVLATGQRRQRLGDLAAATIVVRG